MNDLKSNKILWIVAVVTVLNLMFVVGVKVVTNKAVREVIRQFQKEYSPSPYGPGLDPDKVNMDAVHGQKQVFMLRQLDPIDEVETLEQEVKWSDEWRDSWEIDRGF